MGAFSRADAAPGIGLAARVVFTLSTVSSHLLDTLGCLFPPGRSPFECCPPAFARAAMRPMYRFRSPGSRLEGGMYGSVSWGCLGLSGLVGF